MIRRTALPRSQIPCSECVSVSNVYSVTWRRADRCFSKEVALPLLRGGGDDAALAIDMPELGVPVFVGRTLGEDEGEGPRR
jgi:hypothetical protein